MEQTCQSDTAENKRTTEGLALAFRANSSCHRCSILAVCAGPDVTFFLVGPCSALLGALRCSQDHASLVSDRPEAGRCLCHAASWTAKLECDPWWSREREGEGAITPRHIDERFGNKSWAAQHMRVGPVLLPGARPTTQDYTQTPNQGLVVCQTCDFTDSLDADDDLTDDPRPALVRPTSRTTTWCRFLPKMEGLFPQADLRRLRTSRSSLQALVFLLNRWGMNPNLFPAAAFSVGYLPRGIRRSTPR